MKASTLLHYPPVRETSLDELLASEIRESPVRLVALDDDPTGGQTVHDVSEYTDWSAETFQEAFSTPDKLFYVLTNSRGMTPQESRRVHLEVAANCAASAREAGVSYMYISRSDSTMRGHYPMETEILRECQEADLGRAIDGEVFCPFFKEGGRFTVGGIQYVLQGDELIPAAETEFARDKTFGYTHSFIPDYIEEKTAGAFKAADVLHIPLEQLRAADIDGICRQLMNVHGFNKICVDAVDYDDLKVFAIAIYRAMAHGKTYIFRTAASLIKVMAGIGDIPLLTREQLISEPVSNGGLVVVGSHTQKTTAQLEELLKLDCVVPVAFNSDTVLESDAAFDAEVRRCIQEEEKIIAAGKTAVCYTRRKLLSLASDTKESALLRSVKISGGVQRLVGELNITPAFVVAKGGITSSDVAVKALGVRRALVMGQIRPGVPVWRTGAESRFPAIPYVIFPGNVGTPQTLREAVAILTDHEL